MSEVLASDPIARIQTIYHAGDDGDKFVLEEKQDAEPIVEANKYLHNLFDERANWKGDGFHRVASIPLTVFMDLEKKGITRDAKAFSRWLNLSENRAFRTRPGRV